MKTHVILIRIIVIVAIWLIQATAASAQNSSNYMEIISNTALNWNIDTESEMENNQPLSGALTIRVKNRSNPSPRSVYVRASTFTTPAGFTAPSIPLQLDYTSDNSSHETNLITTPFTITVTDQRMFSHNKHTNNTVYSFNYNIIQSATNWNFPPGTYNYTLTFSFLNP